MALVVIVFLGLAIRHVPLEQSSAGQLLMKGRTEFALFGFCVPFLMNILIVRVGQRGVRFLLGLFTFLIVFFFAFLPFFLPEMNASALMQQKTLVDENGFCRQSTGFFCGPAAAVNALRILGIHSEEGEMAVLARSNWVTGTPIDLLNEALNQKIDKKGLMSRYKEFSSLDEIPSLPAIVAVEYGLFVDHYVTIIERRIDDLVVIDSLDGRRTSKKKNFVRKWRKVAIYFEKTN